MPDHTLEPAVVRLANDIARQLAHLPEEAAVRSVAEHVASFWEPRMVRQLHAEVARDPERLDPLVVAAVRSVQEPSQSQ